MAHKPAHMAPEGGAHIRRNIIQSLMHTRSGRMTGKRAVAVALAGTLALSPLAVAATQVEIDGSTYQAGTAVSGDGSGGGTWSWDGADALTLDSYQGGGIFARGDLHVELVGDSTVAEEFSTMQVWDGSDLVQAGDITITGEGSLTVNEVYYNGIDCGGSLTIDGTDVTVDMTGNTSDDAGALVANDNVSIVNGANVDLTLNGGGQAGIFMLDYNYQTPGHNVDVVDSTLTVTDADTAGRWSYDESFGIYGYGGTGLDVNIENSDVTLQTDAAIVYSAPVGTDTNLSVTVDAEAQEIVYDNTTISYTSSHYALGDNGAVASGLSVQAPAPAPAPNPDPTPDPDPAPDPDPTPNPEQQVPGNDTVKEPVSDQTSTEVEQLPKTGDATNLAAAAMLAVGGASLALGGRRLLKS